MRLEGKVAVVTGAARGQGAAEAELFAKEGAKVVATDVNFDLLESVVQEIRKKYPNSTIGLKHDVTSETDWKQVVLAAESAFGPITVLVNNAGILRTKHYSDVTFDEWSITMNVNAWSQFVGIKTVSESMKKGGGGSIVNIGSIANHMNTDGLNAYGPSKGAVEGLTRNAAAELAPLNIRVNSIHPGEVATPMLFEVVTEEDIQARVHIIPLRRLGQPIDIANLALFLASDESSYMTGSGIVIDGGVSVAYT